MTRFTTRHATSSHRIPTLVIDGRGYGPGDAIPAAAQATLAKMLGAEAAQRWAEQLPLMSLDAEAAPVPRPYRPPQTIDECFTDPRDDERQRLADWQAARKGRAR
jgi:hypothetical protein